MVLVAAGRELVWQHWEDVYIVYQSSSAETHVFNETTALILRCLERGTLSTDGLKNKTEAALGAGELATEDFSFAVERLEELGLIDSTDDAIAYQ